MTISNQFKVIGFTASAFDLLHSGHVAMLKEAKDQCDWLICGLHVDPSKERHGKNKPIQSIVERYIQLESNCYVDQIIPYETEKDLIDILLTVHIDVRIIGEDYLGMNYTGIGLIKTTYFNRRKHSFSSSNLRDRIKNNETIGRN